MNGVGTSAPSRPPVVQDVQDGLDHTLSQLTALEQRAERIVAAHIGPTGTGRGEDGPTPTPSGFVPQAVYTLHEIEDTIHRISNQLSQLETLHGVKESRAEVPQHERLDRPFR